MKVLFLSCALCALVAVSYAEWQEPDFCKGYNCPEFEVIEEESTTDYEVRRYKAAKWVKSGGTATSERDMKSQMTSSFWNLFGYIMGRNEATMMISMTCPVTTKMTMCNDDSCDPSFERAFFLTYDRQDDAPEPSSSSVAIEDRPELVVYVKSFDGWASQEDYMLEVEKLATSIGDASKFVTGMYYQVGYDSPMTFFDRHNEVWLVKQES